MNVKSVEYRTLGKFKLYIFNFKRNFINRMLGCCYENNFANLFLVHVVSRLVLKYVLHSKMLW